jgi:hypothetical protein
MARTIIVDGAERVACPKCNHGFALSEGISRQAIERYADDFERGLASERRKLEAELAAEAKRRAEREFDSRMKAMQESAAAQETALAKFRAEELTLRRQMRALEEAKKNQDLDYQRKLDEERKRIEAQAREAASAEYGRREAQLKAQIESAQREATDLKRKLEQGSQQTQGEGLEITLEALLRQAFPMDEIVPVPKGMNGADLLQHVRSPSGHVCGAIIWEAKQTKAWQPLWLQKLKDDQQAAGAELAVIVTAVMPKDRSGQGCEPFVREADVWITRFDAARPLAQALRNTLLELHKLRQANHGRSEKMELVYTYICSPQFAQRLKANIDGFAAMRQELESEKAAYTRIWKRRESQLTRMTGSLLGVVGDLQGIGQESLAQLDTIAALPMPAEHETAEL